MGAGDSKLEFKSRINTLEKQIVKSSDHKFWSVLFISPLSVEDIFSLITPEDIRNLRSAQPENLAVLIFKSIEQLHLFSLPRNIAAECTSARNSLYLLSRILPFVFEHDDDNFVQLLFFDNRIPKRIPVEYADDMKRYCATYGTMRDARFEPLLAMQEQQQKQQQQQQQQQVSSSMKQEATDDEKQPNEDKQQQQQQQQPKETVSAEAAAQKSKEEEENEQKQQQKEKEEEERLAAIAAAAKEEEEKQQQKMAAEEEEKKKLQQQQQQKQQQQQPTKKGKKGKKNKGGAASTAPSASTATTTTPSTATTATTPAPTAAPETVEQADSKENVEGVTTKSDTKAETSNTEIEAPAVSNAAPQEQEQKKEEKDPTSSSSSSPQAEKQQQQQQQQQKEDQLAEAPMTTTLPQPQSNIFDFEQYKKSLVLITNIGDRPLNVSLAHVMIDTLMKAMFIPQFTIPVFQLKSETPMVAYSLNPEFLWQSGVGTPRDTSHYAPSAEQNNNRYDVLRCLLACFSQVLYLRVDQCITVDNKFLSIAVSHQMPFLTDVVFSLLNTVLKYDPRGSLPYTTQLMTDYDEKVVELSLNLLSILLHHNPVTIPPAVVPTAATGTATTTENPSDESQQQQQQQDNANKAREALESIESDSDMSYMFEGFVRNLNNIVHAHNTYLPGSQRIIPFYEELLICFWKVLQTNKNFRVFVCRDADIAQILIPLLFLLQNESRDATKFPLVQMTSFILLLLSGHREFSVALNRPIDIKIPLEVQVQGTFSDLLIVSLCKCITSDKGVIKPLFDCLLTVIANISPYVKSLSMIASLKLVNLFEALASPKYLYTSDKNCHFVSLLLETFNNIIQYQYEGNPHIIYSIMRRANVFHELNKKPDLEKICQFITEREKKREYPLPPHLVFIPTQQWVDSWKPRLPLTTVLTMINILNPEVERLCARQTATEEDILKHIKKSTLVGLLPVPHTIIVRTFVTSERIDTYLLTYCWGLIYLKHTEMFSAKNIKLFSVGM